MAAAARARAPSGIGPARGDATPDIREEGLMSTRIRILALVATMLLVGTLGVAKPVAAADGSVRFLSAGPVRLGDGHTAHMRVFLSAVQRPVHVHFLGAGGAVLKTLTVDPQNPNAGPFFEVVFEATFAGPGPNRLGMLSITDGTSNTILEHPTNDGIIAILIGMRNARGIGTMQVTDGDGTPLFILPYVEQDNLLRR
jgi:hypothetical protein